MIGILFLFVVAAAILYFIIQFILRPYMHMQSYTKYEGAVVRKFVPIIGAFQRIQEDYKQYGDEFYEAKLIWKKHPQHRILVSNLYNKCIVFLNQPNLAQDFFQQQNDFIKDEIIIKNRVRLIGRGIAFSEGAEWSKKRKILSSLFHFNYFNNFISVITDIVDEQVNQLLNQSQKCFQSKRLGESIAGSAVVKAFFGVSFNEKIQGDSMAVWLSKLISDNVLQERTLRYFLFGPSILDLGIFADDRDINQRIKLFKNIARSTIQQKLKNPQDNKGTILGVIIENQLLGTKAGLTMDELLSEFMTFFFAGVDTTSHLIAMCFYYLTTQPGIQKKLRSEMKEANVLNNLDFKNIMALKKLDNFIKEVFRHYNYMGSPFFRECVQKTQIGGITINKGDSVGVGWLYMNYNPKYFKDPFMFDPKRWEEIDLKQQPYLFTPFSIGPRGCLGQNFALLEVKIVLLKFLQKFEMKLKEGYDLKFKIKSLYCPVNPMYIEAIPIK